MSCRDLVVHDDRVIGACPRLLQGHLSIHALLEFFPLVCEGKLSALFFTLFWLEAMTMTMTMTMTLYPKAWTCLVLTNRIKMVSQSLSSAEAHNPYYRLGH